MQKGNGNAVNVNIVQVFRISQWRTDFKK